MMKVFLDTNILIDYVDHREKRVYAGLILSMADEGLITLYASYLSYANMGYILRKRTHKDYEDMLQYQCALAAGYDVVVTNNKKDFHEFCKLPFLTSEEFLLQFDYHE
jgi:predicted nucleic acid-binding protein